MPESDGSLHVCQAGAAAARVRTRVQQPVVEITDDCSVGPLLGIDSEHPGARIAFWTDVLCAGSSYRDFSARASLALARQDLQRLASHRGTLILWAASHVSEQLMRRRLHWWLRRAPASVCEIRVDDGRSHTGTGVSVAMHDVATLRAACVYWKKPASTNRLRAYFRVVFRAAPPCPLLTKRKVMRVLIGDFQS